MKPYPKLVMFDLDGTLIEGHVRRANGTSGEFEEVLPFGEVRPIPGAQARVSGLLNADVKVSVCTNKAGIAWGHMTLGECFEKQREFERQFQISAIDWKVGRFSWHEAHGHSEAPVENGYRFDDPDRKPRPGMLLKAMAKLGEEPATSLYVGDMLSDKEAAERAGVEFEWASDFFGRERSETEELYRP